MLNRIHTGHMGMEKCKRRARDVLFWPSMNLHIEETVSQCSTCQENRMANTKEPLIPHLVPDRPWQFVATDIFSLDNENYLVVADYYSRYFEVERLRGLKASVIIHTMKAIFSRQGIPEKVVSDNGPNYASQEFTKFAKEWDFTHTTSSPYHPQSNGLAEKNGANCKMHPEEVEEEGKDPYLSILEYRNTPIDGIGSPAQLLMSRRLRSVLPSTIQQLAPSVTDPSKAQLCLNLKQQRQATNYNKQSKPLPPLREGDYVRLRSQGVKGKWEPAIVTGKAATPRSYFVRTERGEYRRNRRDLLESKVPSTLSPDFEPTISQEESSAPPVSDPGPHQSEESPSQETPPTSIHQDNQIIECPGEMYTTRYGRTVRPPTRLDL